MSIEISPKLVQELRNKTGAGMMSCKKALQEVEGDFDKAMAILRQKGLASADKKATRKATEGVIETYIHTGKKLGVLVELNCETDFVARREEFQDLAKDIAMQIAACPTVDYISLDQIPSLVIESEREAESKKEDLVGKPEPIKNKIVEGRVDKLFKTRCLLDQPYIKDNTKTVDELIKENIAKLGENIRVAKFIRFELGK